MAWKAIIASKERSPLGEFKVIVVFTDGNTKHAKEYVMDNPNVQVLKDQVIARLDYLTALEGIKGDIVIGTILDPTPQVP
jgi:hypothetical protein